jgi:hypothetical protein
MGEGVGVAHFFRQKLSCFALDGHGLALVVCVDYAFDFLPVCTDCAVLSPSGVEGVAGAFAGLAKYLRVGFFGLLVEGLPEAADPASHCS